MLENKISNQQLLFDGHEEDLPKGEFEIKFSNNKSIVVTLFLLTEHAFNDLEIIINPKLFSLITTLCNVHKKGILGIYKNYLDIKVYYLLLDAEAKDEKILIISSFGEIQPARYRLIVEGAWKI